MRGPRRPVLVAVLAAMAMAACDIGGTAQHSPSPKAPHPTASPATTPTPTNTFPLAIYDGPTLDGNGHVVYVVGIGDYGKPTCTDCSFTASEIAKVLVAKPAAARTMSPGVTAIDLPYVSTSKTRVYFLDGDSTVRAIAPDGTVAKVTSIPGTPTVHAAFSVSPDEDRIAVALIDYSSQPIKETAYVANLDGSARVDLFTSTTAYYWPVGWHAGKVILAIGPAVRGGSVPSNQYSATGYALVDAQAGAQPARVGPGECVPTGSLTPAGTACISNPGTPCLRDVAGTVGGATLYHTCLKRLDWAGNETTFVLPKSAATDILATKHAALSIDGRRIITDDMFLADEPGPSGIGTAGMWLAPFQIYPEQPGIGWIDATHVSLMFTYNADGTSFQRIYAIGEGQYGFSNVMFDGYSGGFGFVPRSPVVGPLMGTLPGGL